MDQAIILALLFFLPYVVLPIGVTPFETPKVFIAELLIAALVIAKTTSSPLKILLRKNIFSFLFLFLLLFSLFHYIFQPTSIAFFGNQFRMQGVFLLWLLIIFAYFSGGVTFRKIPVWVITTLLILHLLAALFVTTTIDGRAVGTLGEPNALAAVAIFLWPFLWLSKKASKLSAILQIISMLLAVCIIYISGSRSAMIAFVIQSIFLFFALGRVVSVGKAVIICCLLFTVGLSLPFLQKDTTYENRAEIWQAALIAGYEHPITGWGFGNTEVALKKTNLKLYNRLRGYYVDSSHNIFLDWWVQGGYVGLSLFILLIYCAFRVYIKQNDIIKLSLLLGLIAVMSFNPVSVVTLAQFWWIIGATMHKGEFDIH